MQDRGRTVASMRDARRRLRRGVPVPIAGQQLLGELAQALADSGPLDLGVTPKKCLQALAAILKRRALEAPTGSDAGRGCVTLL